MGENVARETTKCPFCGNEVNLFIFYKDKIVGCKYCGVHIKKRSNADRIRSMTDEELAMFLRPLTECVRCPAWDRDGEYDMRPCYTGKQSCSYMWLSWLKQESEGE